MLRFLRIRNFAIIDSLELEFHHGLNVITGETGAGKSIVLEALGLILGNRAETDLIRSGCNEAVVEAIFDLKEQSITTSRLERQGINLYKNDHELLIKRTIQRNGKNRIYLNDELITLSQLADLCENLVDLCSQHENQSLSKSSFQLELIDRYGALLDIRSQVKETFSAYKSFETELQTLRSNSLVSSSNEDFIRFQIKEIDELSPSENEDEELQLEHKKLRNVGAILEGCQSTLAFLRDSENENNLSALDLIGKAKQRLSKLIEQDPTISNTMHSLEQIHEELVQVSLEIETYCSKIDANPLRIQEVEERLTKLNQLKRKYGLTISDIFEKRTQLENNLSELACLQEKICQTEEKLRFVADAYLEVARKLSKKRHNVAKTLKNSVTDELKELRMPESAFDIEFHPVEPNPLGNTDGLDRIQFLFSANAGVDKKPLGKVASGGELSRLMLALRRTLGDRGGIGVYVFDEIDSGIGGQTGTLVGKKLRDVAEHNQVICITHLPQVAAFANAHYVVEKKTISSKTISDVRQLDEKERVQELARMLGGSQITDKSRAHAKELLKESVT